MGHTHGRSIIAKLQGYETRTAALQLVGAKIAIIPEQLEPLAEGEFYWAQLIGLQVVDLKWRPLGKVDHLLETGANDVLVLKGEREILVPFVMGRVIKRVDLDARYIQADWGRDF